jgi:hypothetical protein
MPAIGAEELALLRADWDAGLDDTVTVQRPTDGRTSGGGTTPVWSTVYTGRGKVLPGKAGLGGTANLERDVAGRLVSVQPWFINLPHGTACDHTNRILCNSRVFEVLSVARWESNEVGRTATCVEVS